MKANKLSYHSLPIFRESDKETQEAWKQRKFDSMLFFCKLYGSEDGVYGIGYTILFEDGSEYGSFHENIGKPKNLQEACFKALYEMLLHAQEELTTSLIIISENKSFLGHMNEPVIRKKKALRELYDSFENIQFSDAESFEIEDIDRLRDSAFSKAKTATEFRTRRKRFHITLLASEREESAEEQKRRLDEIKELMGEMYHKYMTRPPEEKISTCKKELNELANNMKEHPDYDEKRSLLLEELKRYEQEKLLFDKRLKEFEKEKAEAEAKKIAEKERIKKILEKKGFCGECGNKIEKHWKFCPFCSTTVEVPT